MKNRTKRTVAATGIENGNISARQLLELFRQEPLPHSERPHTETVRFRAGAVILNEARIPVLDQGVEQFGNRSWLSICGSLLSNGVDRILRNNGYHLSVVGGCLVCP